MIKIFTTNKDGKIELTKEELKALLDEAWWDGHITTYSTWVYNSPTAVSSNPWSPYTFTCDNASTITITTEGDAHGS